MGNGAVNIYVSVWVCATWASWVKCLRVDSVGYVVAMVTIQKSLWLPKWLCHFRFPPVMLKVVAAPHCHRPVSPKCTLMFSSKILIILVLTHASALHLELTFVHLVWKGSNFTWYVWLVSCPSGTYWKCYSLPSWLPGTFIEKPLGVNVRLSFWPWVYFPWPRRSPYTSTTPLSGPSLF